MMKSVISAAIVASVLVINPIRADEPAAEETVKVDPVNFRDLKAWMPEELAGIKKTDSEGQRTAMGEMKLSTASATYQSEEGASVRLEVIDYGAMGEMAKFAAGWANIEIDQETDTQYTRTIEVKGCKAMETYDSESKSGTLQIFVADRFILSANIEQLDSAKLKEIGEALDLEKLAAMK